MKNAAELESLYASVKPYLPTSPTMVAEVKVYIQTHLNAWLMQIEQWKEMSKGHIPMDRQYADFSRTYSLAQQEVAKIRVLLERVCAESP